MRTLIAPIALMSCAGCMNVTSVGRPGAEMVSSLIALCAAQPGQRPVYSGIIVTDEPPVPDDLPSLRVTSVATGAYLFVHYDAGSESAARASAPCLGAQLPLLERELGDERRGARWWGAVFTQDPAYVPPRAPEAVPRWTVAVDPSGHLSASARETLVLTMPHEQAHAYQGRARASLPRWLREGHANWIERRISPQLDPGLASKEAAGRARAAANHGGAANLLLWGIDGRPKREAVMRQLSPADRARMETDPDFQPLGTFTFEPDDFEDNNSNEHMRYILAGAIVEGLATRHGAEKVRTWMTSLTSRSQIWPDDRDRALVRSVAETFGEDLNALLVEPVSSSSILER